MVHKQRSSHTAQLVTVTTLTFLTLKREKKRKEKSTTGNAMHTRFSTSLVHTPFSPPHSLEKKTSPLAHGYIQSYFLRSHCTRHNFLSWVSSVLCRLSAWVASIHTHARLVSRLFLSLDSPSLLTFNAHKRRIFKSLRKHNVRFMLFKNALLITEVFFQLFRRMFTYVVHNFFPVLPRRHYY